MATRKEPIRRAPKKPTGYRVSDDPDPRATFSTMIEGLRGMLPMLAPSLMQGVELARKNPQISIVVPVDAFGDDPMMLVAALRYVTAAGYRVVVLPPGTLVSPDKVAE